jgi:type 2 lantibiotic biosynthesis protein LanM
MRSANAPPISSEDQRWRAGLTLAERLSAVNLPHSRMSKPQAAVRNKIIRWQMERRTDIARTRDVAALRLDPPSWLRTFRAAYAEATCSQQSLSASRDFLVAVEPILAPARGRVRAAIQDCAQGLCPASEDGRATLLQSLEARLREQLYNAISKTLVLELAVAKKRTALIGGSPEQRFAFFCECLADPSFARALLEQYPVLVQRVTSMISKWEVTTIALLSRLQASRQILIQTFFDGEDPGPLVSAQSSGDSHRGGQAVHILHFNAGHRLVYKPRSVALESCFFAFVAWLNSNGIEPNLKEVRTLDEDSFGWMQFVAANPCQTEAEIERFFVRQGAQLAMTYILGSTDLHFENVIAHGEYPVLVDLETLFQAPFLPMGLPRATALGWQILQTSVMRTLLLPQPTIYEAGGKDWMDPSALGYSEGQLTPSRVPTWRGSGTDNMRLEYLRLPMERGTSLPEFGGKPVRASQHVELVVRGFCDMYEFLRRRASELVSESGPLAAALDKPVRHVFRPTHQYGLLLNASYHPRFLEDGIIAEAFLHNQLRAGTEDTPWLAALEDAEVADLMAGDIPYFSSRLGPCAPIVGTKQPELLVANDGWSAFRARLQALSEADLKRQIWLVQVAMADRTAPPDLPAFITSRSLDDPAPEQLVDIATRIGDRICDLAIMDGERPTWLQPAVLPDEARLVTTVAGLDLFSGLPGIALFLGHLSSVTGECRYGRVAAGAIMEALALYESADSETLAPGAYDGVGGLAIALVHLARLLDHPQWIGEATAILHETARRALRWPQVDIGWGQAGLLVAAIAVHEHTSNPALIRSMAPLAKALHGLVTKARKSGKVTLPNAADAGVAHGRAGIGFALSRWAVAVNDDTYGESAAQLIRFDVEAINGLAAQQPGRDHSHAHNDVRLKWCRGLLGIALMALQARNVQIGGGAAWFMDIADHVIADGPEVPLCLCHGALGRLEFLAEMAERGLLRNPQAAAEWRRQVFARIGGGEWVGDDFHRLESPGLMLGLAGTGYSLLRVARPQSMSSVLTLTA